MKGWGWGISWLHKFFPYSVIVDLAKTNFDKNWNVLFGIYLVQGRLSISGLFVLHILFSTPLPSRVPIVNFPNDSQQAVCILRCLSITRVSTVAMHSGITLQKSLIGVGG